MWPRPAIRFHCAFFGPFCDPAYRSPYKLPLRCYLEYRHHYLRIRWKPFNCSLAVVPSSTSVDSKPTLACLTKHLVRQLERILSIILSNCYTATKERKSRAQAAPDSLPSELDFFKYSQSTQPKRKADDTSTSKLASRKRRKVLSEGAQLESDEDDSDVGGKGGEDDHVPGHRVTVKGRDAPAAISSFMKMKERYNIAGHVMANLEKFGFERPTGIQSHGCPILLEVWMITYACRTSLISTQKRDMAAISPTGTGKTLSYLLPIMSALRAPSSSAETDVAPGVRAIVLAPTKELAHQIHNECLKLALGRKWRLVLFSKATAATLADKAVRDKVGMGRVTGPR